MRLLLLCLPLLVFAESEQEALFLRRIADFWQEGEFRIAKSQMQEFLGKYPEHEFADPVQAALGDLLLREKDYENALKSYTALRTKEFQKKVFLNRMQCLYELQWYATLAEECEAFLDEEESPHAAYFLAIALYHQALSSPEPREAAARAAAIFEQLSQSELSGEVAQGYAHLLVLQKDYPKAAGIYLDLAKQDPHVEEEMLFQAALIQAEYDKELSLQQFIKIGEKGGKRAPDAAYNRLALLFDLGRYEEAASEERLLGIAQEKLSAARLFTGRSLLQLGKHKEAIAVLKAAEGRAALLSLAEAADKARDLASLKWVLERLGSEDPELPKVRFSVGQMLIAEGNLNDARQIMESISSVDALFALVQVDSLEGRWAACKEKAERFLAEAPQHERVPFVERYRLGALAEISKSDEGVRSLLAKDLTAFLEGTIPEGERREWTQLLAQTLYELGEYDKALSLLGDTPNEELMKACCYREGKGDLKKFCELAESAFGKGANLLTAEQMRFALFNAWLQLGQEREAADHLLAALEAGATVQEENVLWLSEVLYRRLVEEEPTCDMARKVLFVMEKTPESEKRSCRLAKSYLLAKEVDRAIALLQGRTDGEAQLILGECYALQGLKEKACEFFDAIVAANANLRHAESASACLQGALLRKDDGVQTAVSLKNLMLQKTLEQEPIYLEAALEYVDLLSKGDVKRKKALLQKVKQDFEAEDDLLAQDYHKAMERLAEKGKMYRGYMQLIDAELARLDGKVVQADAIYLQILEEQRGAALVKRARLQLTSQ